MQLQPPKQQSISQRRFCAGLAIFTVAETILRFQRRTVLEQYR